MGAHGRSNGIETMYWVLWLVQRHSIRSYSVDKLDWSHVKIGHSRYLRHLLVALCLSFAGQWVRERHQLCYYLLFLIQNHASIDRLTRMNHGWLKSRSFFFLRKKLLFQKGAIFLGCSPVALLWVLMFLLLFFRWEKIWVQNIPA